jgi:hypothetical protein
MRYYLSIRRYPDAPWYKFLYLSGVRKGSVIDPKADRFVHVVSDYLYYQVEIPFFMAKWVFAPLLWGRTIRQSKDIHFPSEE